MRKPTEPTKNGFRPGVRLGEVRKLLQHRYYGSLDADKEELRILLHSVA